MNFTVVQLWIVQLTVVQPKICSINLFKSSCSEGFWPGDMEGENGPVAEATGLYQSMVVTGFGWSL